MSRFPYVISSVLLGVLLMAFQSQQDLDNQTEPPQKPNIIFILSDDHAYQAVSAYQHPVGRIAPTPNIDRIAQNGVRFDRAFCANALCGPSRASILTGQHNHLNGFRRNGNRFDATQWQWHKALDNVGYTTAVIGKWHLGVDPDGFDYYDVLNGQGHYYNPVFRSNDGRGEYQLEGYTTDIITEKGMEWLKQNHTDNPDQPFALLLWHKAPHRNWQPAPRHHNIYDSTYFPVPHNYFDEYRGRPAASMQMMEVYNPNHVYEGHDLKMTKPGTDELRFDPWKEHFGRFTEAQRKEWNDNYRGKNDYFNKIEPHITQEQIALWKYQRYLQEYMGSIASVDEGVGEVLDWLESTGLDKNTIVVYSSDQGFFLGEHGWLDKRFMYEESLRIPLLMQYGDQLPAGSVEQAMVQNIDFAPTLLEFAGVDIPEEVQGRSFASAAKDESDNEHYASIYYHFYEFPGIHTARRHYGVRNDRYKLIHFYHDLDYWELYDLEADPLEMNNIYGDPEYKQVQKDMHEELKKLENQYAVPPREEWGNR